jgi:Peptidase family M28
MLEPILDSRRVNWTLRLVVAGAFFLFVLAVAWIWQMVEMPLRSYSGTLPPMSQDESKLASRLAEHIQYLSTKLGEKNLAHPAELDAAAAYIKNSLQTYGYTVVEHSYVVAGQQVKNLEVMLDGSDTNAGQVVIGAHYDTVRGAPGANDNGSGVAAVLELARQFRREKPRKTIRLVLFVNEEPPYFQTSDMGSLVYARELRRDNVQISSMLSLETIGYYSDQPGSQKYPPVLSLFYPNKGNFIGFVGNPESRDLVRRAIRQFRESTKFPSEGIAAPSDWPGIGWSDHWSFWQAGYPAIMVTDTAPFRYPYYHTPDDTMKHVDCEKMARVVVGIRQVIEELAAK